MTRVVWTNAEKQEVFSNMVPVFVGQPHLSNREALKLAQLVLPYARRIKGTDQQAHTYKPRIQAARTQALEFEKEYLAAEAAKQEPLPVELPPKEEPRQIDGIGDLFELLIDAVADRIMEKMIAAKQEHEKQSEAAKTEDHEPAFGNGWLDELEKLSIRSKERRAKRPTALVIGLNGHQMECVKQSRPEVDFTFATAEQALSHYTFNKDHTFLMTKFINHSVQTKYRKHPNLHYVNGGVSELKTLLHGLFKGAA